MFATLSSLILEVTSVSIPKLSADVLTLLTLTSLRISLLSALSSKIGAEVLLNSNPDREWEETELKMKTILEIIKANISYEN